MRITIDVFKLDLFLNWHLTYMEWSRFEIYLYDSKIVLILEKLDLIQETVWWECKGKSIVKTCYVFTLQERVLQIVTNLPREI